MDRSYWLTALGRLQVRECKAPVCMCPHAILFVWRAGRKVHYELRIRTGKRHQGGAETEPDALRFAGTTLLEQGLERFRVVHGRPTEVPNA